MSQPAYQAQAGGGPTPVSDDIAARVMSLPMSPGLSEADQARIAAVLRDALTPK